MIKDNKKLYYKYFDLYRVCEFLGEKTESYRATQNMAIIQSNFEINIVALLPDVLLSFGFDSKTCEEIQEFSLTKNITYITSKVNSLDSWILGVILPDFFPIQIISDIFRSESITSKKLLEDYFLSYKSIELYGKDYSELYHYFVTNSDNSSFPQKYRDLLPCDLIHTVNRAHIYGNFHNHSTYSDGKLTVQQLHDLAVSKGRAFIGISDHTKRVNGIDTSAAIRQHREIDELNNSSLSCRILKGVECEILLDGNLDLPNETLKMFDYVIVAAHRDTNMIKSDATNRLIKAIENPATNILAHPSSRLYGKNVGLFVDMQRVIDACIYNHVIIEINGDKDRLDLDPKYIDYALNKGAMFSLDSDTHSEAGFYSINNSISISEDYRIPPERIINTYQSFNFIEYKAR